MKAGKAGDLFPVDILYVAGNVGEKVTRSTAQTIVADSTSSTSRKILGQAEKNVLFT